MTKVSSDLALSYLEQYKKELFPLIEKFFKEEAGRAKKIGKRTKEALDFFWEMTKRGKKVRGALVKIGYEISGARQKEKALWLGLALEIFHSAILIHDDILDRDTLRRGEKTCWYFWQEKGKKEQLPDPKHFGISMAINTGDLGFYLAQRAFRKAELQGERERRAREEFEEMITNVIYGQILDINNTIVQGFSEKEVLQVFYFKTALYTGKGPLLLGYKAGGGKDPKIEKALDKFGEKIGWAFQIRDDILGIFGDPKTTGKSVGGDLREGKNNYVVLLALQRMTLAQKREFLEKIRKGKSLSQKELKELVEAIETTGAREVAEKKIKRYYLASLRELNAFPSPFSSLLASFSHLFCFREK